jgi:hypothetical protein
MPIGQALAIVTDAGNEIVWLTGCLALMLYMMQEEYVVNITASFLHLLNSEFGQIPTDLRLE